MRKQDCFNLGHISRTYGYKGKVIAVFDTDQPQKYIELKSVFVDIQGELVPHFLEELAQSSKGHFIILFKGFESERQALEVTNRDLYLPLEILPPLKGKSFYFHDVIGFKMIDQQHGYIGDCAEVMITTQAVFRILEGTKEIFVPAVDNFIIDIRRDKQEILLQTPDGLIELYRNAE